MGRVTLPLAVPILLTGSNLSSNQSTSKPALCGPLGAVNVAQVLELSPSGD